VNNSPNVSAINTMNYILAALSWMLLFEVHVVN